MAEPLAEGGMAVADRAAAARRELLEAASGGRLREYLESEPERGNAALYAVVSAVVFQHLTRPLELRRGHFGCAGSGPMEPDCQDRFEDDVAAVRADLLRHADLRFENLCGWLARRLNPVTIDAYRRRRAQTGALQRPRLPRWLADELGEDPWRRRLALNILEWVGVTATAGYDLWPLRAWAQQRARLAAGPEFTDAQLEAEVNRVLAAMRRRPKWYADYVERPLGHKQAPLAPAQRTDAAGFREPGHLRYVEPDDAEDALLTELAAMAIEIIGVRLAAGEPARELVAEVLGVVFGTSTGTGAGELDRAPGSGPRLSAQERAAQLVLEPEVLDRVVAAVLELVAENGP